MMITALSRVSAPAGLEEAGEVLAPETAVPPRTSGYTRQDSQKHTWGRALWPLQRPRDKEGVSADSGLALERGKSPLGPP